MDVTLTLSKEDFERLAFLVTIGASVFSDWTKRDPERARETGEYEQIVLKVNDLLEETT